MALRRFYLGALCAITLLFISGCSGGGGDSSSAQANANTPPVANTPDDQTGVVGIIIKDAPSDDYTRIMLRISRVELLGNGSPQTVFDGDLEFDLLALRNHANLLSLSDEVATGDYNKIRLRVTSITLYCLDAGGDEISVDVRVPANGKVDLNPRGSFTVAADSALLIQIDLDAKKSIHIVGTGNGSHRFRPVVFVDIDEHAVPQGLIRVSGIVGQINEDPDWFDLCDLDVHVDSSTDGCIRVNVDDATAFFDGAGQPQGGDELMQDETVTVFAEAIAVPLADDDDSTDDDGTDDDSADDDTIRMVQLSAFVVHEGDPADVLSLDGTAQNTVTADAFQFEVDAGQELPESVIDVLLHDSTRILWAEDLSEVDRSAIDAGVLAEVSGMLQPGIPEDPQQLSAALIVIDGTEPATGLTELEGTVQSVDTDSFTMFAENEEPAGDRCVAPLADARYLVVMDSEEGADHTEVDADYLEAGQAVSVFGAYAAGGDCFEADTIIIDESDNDDD